MWRGLFPRRPRRNLEHETAQELRRLSERAAQRLVHRRPLAPGERVWIGWCQGAFPRPFCVHGAYFALVARSWEEAFEGLEISGWATARFFSESSQLVCLDCLMWSRNYRAPMMDELEERDLVWSSRA
jgi:hypothetical protein